MSPKQCTKCQLEFPFKLSALNINHNQLIDVDYSFCPNCGNKLIMGK